MSATIISNACSIFTDFDNLRLKEMKDNLWRSVDTTSSPNTHSWSSARDNGVSLQKNFDLSSVSNCPYPGRSNRQNTKHELSSYSSSDSLTDSSTPVNLPLNFSVSNICTIYMDMSLEDRIFFGVYNLEPLVDLVHKFPCDVNFSASDNKVSIIGLQPNVLKMCQMFIGFSTISLQIEFRSHDNENYDNLLNELELFDQHISQYCDVFVSFYPTKLNTILFTSFCSEKNCLALRNVIVNYLSHTNLGKFVANYISSMQIPSNRRDLTGRRNMHIEQIQKETQTKIEVVRIEDPRYFLYPFEKLIITGDNINSVIEARLQFICKFSYELKFEVSIVETQTLANYIFNLSSKLKDSISVSIEPINKGPNIKIISITGNKNIDKLFEIRNELLEQVQNGFQVQTF